MKFAFIVSEDTYLAAEKIQVLIEGYAQKDTSAVYEKKVFWADEGVSADFWQELTVSNLEQKKTILILRAAQVLNADTWKKISETLGFLREDILVCFCIESSWEKGLAKIPAYITGLKCFLFAEKKGWIFRIAPLDAKSMQKYVQQGMQKRKLTCDNHALQLLVSSLIPSASLVDNTLNQLELMAVNGKVLEEHLNNLAVAVPEIILFDYIKMLETKRTFELWKSLFYENNADEVFFPFLGILTREARLLWQISVGESVKLPSFVLDSKRNTAYKLEKKGIVRLFELIMEADWSIKSGKKQVSQALEELIVSLTNLYS